MDSQLTGFVALDFGEKLVSQQEIPTLHRHQQILFFPHDYGLSHNNTNSSQFTAKVTVLGLFNVPSSRYFQQIFVRELTGSC